MKIRLAEDVVWRDLIDEVVILDLKSGTYFGLEGAGNDIWRLIAEHGSRDEVLAMLDTRFEVDKERLRADFDALVSELEQKGLVRVEHSNGAASDSNSARGDAASSAPQAGPGDDSERACAIDSSGKPRQ